MKTKKLVLSMTVVMVFIGTLSICCYGIIKQYGIWWGLLADMIYGGFGIAMLTFGVLACFDDFVNWVNNEKSWF